MRGGPRWLDNECHERFSQDIRRGHSPIWKQTGVTNEIDGPPMGPKNARARVSQASRSSTCSAT